MSISLSHNHLERGSPGIAGAMRRAILDGELAPGAQLPPIAELARRHGTTSVTVRRALRDLEDEGLVRVAHGVGTFVADWSRQFDLLHLPSFTAEMTARDRRPDTEVLGRDLDALHAEQARALGRPGEEPVHVLTRLRRIDSVPVVLQHSYVAGRLGKVVEAYTPDRSLYEMVREAVARAPVAAEETIRALPLPEHVTEVLALDAGALGWLSTRLTVDAAGEPLVYDEAFFPAERVELHVRRRAGQTLFDYRILSKTEDAG